MKNGVNGKNKKSQNNLDTLQAQEPPTQQRSSGSLKEKLRLPRPKSHSVGPDTVQQIRSQQQQQQNSRDYSSNNNEMTTLSHTTADVLTISSGKKGVGQQELVPTMAGSSIEIGRLGGVGRTTGFESGYGLGSGRNSNVYTPPGVPMVD